MPHASSHHGMRDTADLISDNVSTQSRNMMDATSSRVSSSRATDRNRFVQCCMDSCSTLPNQFGLWSLIRMWFNSSPLPAWFTAKST